VSEEVDVEDDAIELGWAVAPTEACTFVALAVFARKRDAERFRDSLARTRNTYDDLAVLPARARVLVANSYDVKAGRKALAKETL
jgi:hypothetical protein